MQEVRLGIVLLTIGLAFLGSVVGQARAPTRRTGRCAAHEQDDTIRLRLDAVTAFAPST